MYILSPFVGVLKTNYEKGKPNAQSGKLQELQYLIDYYTEPG
jgi:hypothetical protein